MYLFIDNKIIPEEHHQVFTKWLLELKSEISKVARYKVNIQVYKMAIAK